MSSPSSYHYETIYIVRSSVNDTDAATIHQKIDNVITKFDGKLMHRDDWGNREMAYLIDDETNGKYSVIVYTGKSGVVEEIERHFKITEDVIRFLTVKTPFGYDYQKALKQINLSEEEVKRNREARELRKRAQQDMR